MISHRERLVALAARHALPASYAARETVVAGGLKSYGTSLSDALRQVGVYTGAVRDVEPAARAMGLRIQVLNASTNDAPEPFEVGGPGGIIKK